MIEKLSKYKIEIFGLIAILLLASFFYFYHIAQKGIFTYDEGNNFLMANTYASAAKTVMNYILHGGNLQDLALQYLPGAIFFTTTAKPLFIILGALGIITFGYHDFSIFIINGIIGLGAIIALYYLARLITKNSFQALMAAFFLAISGYQVFYARAAFSSVVTGLLLVLGSFFYVKTLSQDNNFSVQIERRNLLLAGGFWGLMFLSHYNAILILFFVLFFEIVFTLFFNKQRHCVLIRRLAYILIPFVGILLGAQILFIARNYLLAKTNYPRQIPSYFEEISEQYKIVLPTQISGKWWQGTKPDSFFYLKLLNDLNGSPYIFLFLISPLVFFYKKWYRNPPLIFIFFITAGIFLSSSLFVAKVTRQLIALNGFISLVAALSFWEILQLVKKRGYKILGYLLLLLLLIFQFQKDWQIINLRSTYHEAADFLNSLNVTTENIYSQAWPILSFYLNKKVQIITQNPKTIYFVSDWQAADCPYRRGKLIASFDNPIGIFPAVLGEAGFDIQEPEPGKINIYKFQQY